MERIAGIDAVRRRGPAAKKPHDPERQAPADQCGEVKPDDGHDDDVELSIHGCPPIRSERLDLGLAALVPYPILDTATQRVKY